MNVFFEDDGTFRAGSILADNDTSLQVETSTGKRVKVKSANVLLRFAAPAAGALLERAGVLAEGLDPGFLWEVSGEDEFGFGDLAADYHGRTPAAEEAAAFVLRLHGSPMYFYKRGKGRYRRAPAEALAAALASVERKRREGEQVEQWVSSLVEGKLPAPIAAVLPRLLYAPDRQALETRAVEKACAITKSNPVALLARCGAITSTHDYHFNRFLFQTFPRGTGFPDLAPPDPLPELPEAAVRAFSIDDASTTEIDDAFSVTALPGGGHRIGIHIAAPALGIPRGSPLDAIARERLSTVYMPGRKITMFPDPVIDRFTLAAGRDCPALSMYLDVDPEGAIVAQASRAERIHVAANLRHDRIDERFAEPGFSSDQAFEEELRVLSGFAKRLEAARGKVDQERVDYNFLVDWDAAPEGRVSILPRRRGSPLDKLVSELMIHVNSGWGKLLADADWPGLFRTQNFGKVKMSTRPEPHQGLGLAQYLWASSPLRRFSDLANQRQILALLAGGRPAYGANDAELAAAMVDFEATYSAYAEFQSQMEHYWCLRYLVQEKAETVFATLIRENLVRFQSLPIVMRVADVPALPPDSDLRLAVVSVDLLAATLDVRFAGVAGVRQDI